jgi:hypothetical protein
VRACRVHVLLRTYVMFVRFNYETLSLRFDLPLHFVILSRICFEECFLYADHAKRLSFHPLGIHWVP